VPLTDRHTDRRAFPLVEMLAMDGHNNSMLPISIDECQDAMHTSDASFSALIAMLP
jgi:hypothetical protein